MSAVSDPPQCCECGQTGVELNALENGHPVCRRCYLSRARRRGDPVLPDNEPEPVHARSKPRERYAGRVLDMRALLAKPDEPIPWRCDELAADGYLTTIAGKGGEGKSWLALTLGCGVARGKPAAGTECVKGRVLIFDAENGAKLITRRFRNAQVHDLDVQPVEACGLRILTDIGWFEATIRNYRANLVIFDSLRVLSSGAKENDGDAMEPIITALKQLARDTGAAIVLIHHRGKNAESDYRGASAILDQTDMMFRLERVTGDPERHRRKIKTLKCRIEEEPEARWVQIVTDRARGLVTVDAAEPYDEPKPRDKLREQVLGALTGISQSQGRIARLVGRDPKDQSVRRVLRDLSEDGLAERRPDGWRVSTQTPLELDTPDTPPENGSNKPNEGVSAGLIPAGSDTPGNGHDSDAGARPLTGADFASWEPYRPGEGSS